MTHHLCIACLNGFAHDIVYPVKVLAMIQLPIWLDSFSTFQDYKINT